MPKFIVVVCAFLNDCGFKKEKEKKRMIVQILNLSFENI